MIKNISPHRASGYGFVARRLAKSLLILPVMTCVMAVSSCKEDEGLMPDLKVVADTKPIGNGLSVIGFALLGASVVFVIGRLLKPNDS